MSHHASQDHLVDQDVELLKYAIDNTGQGQTLSYALTNITFPSIAFRHVTSIAEYSVKEDASPSLPSRLMTWLVQSSGIGFGGYSLRRWSLVFLSVVLATVISGPMVAEAQQLLAIRAFVNRSVVTQLVDIALTRDTVPSRWGVWDTLMAGMAGWWMA